jgi:hypothetical protein
VSGLFCCFTPPPADGKCGAALPTGVCGNDDPGSTGGPPVGDRGTPAPFVKPPCHGTGIFFRGNHRSTGWIQETGEGLFESP